MQSLHGAALAAVLALGMAAGTAGAQSQPGTATSTGISRDFNPAISVNALFLGAGFSDLDVPEVDRSELEVSGLRLQEMEVQFTSAIDPYSKADLILSYEDGEFSVEEAFVRTTALPGGVGLRAGKMYVPIGIENTLHTHQLPFVQRSLAGAALFDETLSDFGLETSFLVPAPFFLDVRAAAYDGDAAFFGAAGDWDLAYLAGTSALWDLTDDATLGFEGDVLAGRNGLGDATRTSVAAAGVTVKWRPARRANYRSLRLTGEFLYGERDAGDPQFEETMRGFYTLAQWQWARRFWLQGRWERARAAAAATAAWRATAAVGFVPSEFQALRLQAAYVDRPDDTWTEFYVQYNFTIGSHPAHKY